MKKRLTNISFGLLSLTIIVLAAASFMDKRYGTQLTHKYIYGSWAFAALWMMLAISSLFSILRYWHAVMRHSLIFLHVSFAVILLGAGLTFLTGKQGDIYLHNGQPADSFITKDGKQQRLPFNMKLCNFNIEYYAGTDSPMDFVSHVAFSDGDEQQVSMNNIAKKQYYRFYQSGYDTESGWVHLSVSYDPLGITVTYCGYILLLLSIIAFLADPRGGFRRTIRQVMKKESVKAKALVLALLLLAPMKMLSSSNIPLPKTLPTALAERFGDLYVYHCGRICPMQTMARDLTIKLYGSDSYRGYTAEQVLVGWLLYPTDWVEQPMIKVSGGSVRKALNANGRYVSWMDYTSDTQGFKLSSLIEQMNKGSLSNSEARDVAAAYEKYNIIASLMSGQAVRMFPVKAAGSLRWMAQGDQLPEGLGQDEWLFIKRSTDYVMELALAKDNTGVEKVLQKIREYQQKKAGTVLPSDSRFKAEKIYNSLQFSFPMAILLIVAGILFYIMTARNLLRSKPQQRSLKLCGSLLLALSACFILVVIALRGYVGGHMPLSNGFETMQFMALCMLVIALPLGKRIPFFLPFGLMAAGLALMVSMLGERNPQITTLMPVLASPLLSIHVILVMLSYSLFAFLFFNGVTALIMNRMGSSTSILHRLTDISRIMLYPAVFLLAVGIFTGAVWANVSWGRYWGWDPKETWALITMLVYSLTFHEQSLPAFRRPIFLHVYIVLAFLTVLMTYFGVNYVLRGMHSYA